MEIIILLILAALGLFGSKSSSNNYRSYRKPNKYKPRNNWTFNFENSADKDTHWSSLRKEVFSRDGYKCVKCGFSKNLTVDHITPRHAGGTDDLINLRTLCALCHEEVHNRKIFSEDEVFSTHQKQYKPNSKVTKINSAIGSNDSLTIEYSDEKGKTTHREIKPLRIFEEHGILYVRSYCMLRNAERTFRLSRMTIN
jgi:hypothetical protein